MKGRDITACAAQYIKLEQQKDTIITGRKTHLPPFQYLQGVFSKGIFQYYQLPKHPKHMTAFICEHFISYLLCCSSSTKRIYSRRYTGIITPNLKKIKISKTNTALTLQGYTFCSDHKGLMIKCCYQSGAHRQVEAPHLMWQLRRARRRTDPFLEEQRWWCTDWGQRQQELDLLKTHLSVKTNLTRTEALPKYLQLSGWGLDWLNTAEQGLTLF